MGGLGYLATPGTGTGWAKWLKPGGKGDWWKRFLLPSTTSADNLTTDVIHNKGLLSKFPGGLWGLAGTAAAAATSGAGGSS